MAFLKTILFTVGIISSFLIQTQGADKYTDENRPYEFGFKIDGEQHRHEKKDEKGLIMGEFGFITADGVYHVTVYATDEQGRFKILSMKNIRVKPYPTYKRPEAGSARQGHSLDTQTIPNEQHLAKPETPEKTISIEPPGRSCSSCSLPTTTTQAPSTFVQPNVQNTPYRSNGNNFGPNSASAIPQNTQGAKANSFPNQQDAFNGQNVQSPSFPENKQNNYNNPQTYSQQNFGPSQTAPEKELVAPNPDSPSLYRPNSNNFGQNSPSAIPQYTQGVKGNSLPNQHDNFNGQNVQSPLSQPQSTQPQGFEPDSQSVRDDISSGRTPKKYDGPQQSFASAGPQPNGISNNDAGFNQGQTLPNKPTLISAQMQIVDKNTDIYQRGPGEKEGLPNGLTKDDMTQLLYTFNYTVGFHGHFEEGYRSGAKQGYYYVTGRNGVRTRVDYVADEKGFRPKITQEVLDLLSDDVPKPETEKDEKYGLKGYEFKWLYYPVEYNKH